MAKFNEYTQKATPADNDTLMIYDAAAKANKLSPFSGIWNWIVGKLTNAVISNLQTSNQTVIGAINELGGNSHLGTLNDNIAEYLRKTKKVATAYFVWGNIGGLYPSWAWGTLLCSNDNTANFIGIANSNKTAAFAHYENGAWEKVPVESLSNLTTTNKSSLVGAINELNSKTPSKNVNSLENYIKNAPIGVSFCDCQNADDNPFKGNMSICMTFVNDDHSWGVQYLFVYKDIRYRTMSTGAVDEWKQIA